MDRSDFPDEARPDGPRGKFSYTKKNGVIRIEVNFKQRHFRVNAQAPGTPPVLGSPNVPWSSYSDLRDAWVHCKKLAGWS